MRSASAWRGLTISCLPLLLLVAGCSRLIDLDDLSKGGSRTHMDGGPSDGGLDAQTWLDAEVDGSSAPDGGMDADLPDGGPVGYCPRRAGMTMSLVAAGGADFCIDRTEVTRAQFGAFQSAAPTLAPLLSDAACGGTKDVTPLGFPFAPGSEQHPVTGVTFCAAQAYCAWVGKTLCGDRAGGALTEARRGDPAHDAWQRACEGSSARSYPYADRYDAEACNGEHRLGGISAPVSSLRSCVTPETDLYDLSGNVWEWTDACDEPVDGGVGLAAACRIRGGAHNAGAAELACDADGLRVGRGAQRSDLGFRCCARPIADPDPAPDAGADAGEGGTSVNDGGGVPGEITLDGVLDTLEWANAEATGQTLVTEWKDNSFSALFATIDDTYLWIGVRGSVEQGLNALVVYIDARPGTGTVLDEIDDKLPANQLDNALSCDLTTVGFGADFAWGTLRMTVNVTGSDEYTGVRDLKDPSNLFWVEAPGTGPFVQTVCSASACETRIPLTTLKGSGPISMFGRINSAGGFAVSNQTLPLDDPNDSDTVTRVLSVHRP